LIQISQSFVSQMISAVLQGTAALLIALLVVRLAPRLPARFKVWCLRLAMLKMILALFPVVVVQVDVPTSGTGATSSALTFWSVAAFVSWLCYALWRLGFTLWSFGKLSELHKSAKPITDTALHRRVAQIASNMGVRSGIVAWQSDQARCPMLLGWPKARLLLPSADVDDEAIAHELAHIKHKDLAWGWVALLAQSLFFFHPLVPLASRTLRNCEEEAADLEAVRVTGVTPAIYSRVLLRWALPSDQRRAQTFAFGATAKQLEGRIRTVFGAEQPRPRTRLAMAALGLVMFLTILPWKVAAVEQPLFEAVAAPRTFSPGAASGRGHERVFSPIAAAGG
jgi:bla regulator protein blaR1